MASRSIHDAILRVLGDTDDAKRKVHDLNADLDAFARKEATATIDLNDRGITRKLEEARRQLAQFAATTANADADVDTVGARANLERLEADLDKIDHKRVTPEVSAKVTKAVLALQALDAKLDDIDHKRVTVDVDVRRGIAEKALALERSIEGIVREAEQGTQALGQFGSAAGGLGSQFKSVSGGAGVFGGALEFVLSASVVLIPIIGSLVGALAALIGSLAAAAAAAGALGVALGAALGPALGVVGATGARVVGIMSTQKKETAAAASAYREATGATKELATAHREEYKATTAVRDAREQLVAALRNYSDAAREAWKEIREASRDLRKVEAETARAVKAAQNEEKRAVRDLAEARVKAAEEEKDAIRAVADAERDLRDARLGTQDAALGLLDAEDELQGQQEELRASLEALGLTGAELDRVLSTLSTADLGSLDIGALFSSAGIGLTPQQIEAVSDAARGLQHAQLGVRHSTNEVTDANTELARSQDTVNEFAQQGLLAYKPYAEALKEVKEASQALAKAEDETSRIQQKGYKEVEAAAAALLRLQKDGIKDNRSVIAAAESLRDAHQALTEALRQQAEASKKAQAAGGGAAGGGGGGAGEVEKLTGLNKRFAEALKEVKKALTEAFKPATTAVLQGLIKAFEAIAPLLKELKPGFTAIGQVIGGQIASAAKSLAGPEWTKALKFFVSSSATVTKLVGSSFGQLAVILRNIAVASMPFLIAGLRKVRDFLQGIASNTSATGKLRDNIGGLVGHLKAWLGLAGALGSVMVALLGGETAKAGKGLVEVLTEGANKLAAWARSAKGQEAIKRFFEETMPLVKALAELFGKLVVAGLLFTQAMAPVLAPFVKGFTALVGIVNVLLGLFTKIPAPIREATATALNLVFGFGKLEAVADLLKNGLGGLGNAFGAVAGAVGGAAGAVASAAADVGGRAVDAITGLASGAFIAGKGLIEKVAAGITAVLSDPVGAADAVVNAVIGKVTGAADRALSAGKSLFERVKGGINAAFGAVAGAAQDVINAVIGKVTGAADRAFNAAENLFGRVKGGISSAMSAVVGAAGDVINAVIGKITDAWDRAKATAETLFEKARAGINAARELVVEAAQGLINAAVETIKDASGRFFDAGVSLMRSLLNGVKSMAEEVVNAVKDVIGKARDLLPGSEPKDPSSPLRGLPRRGRALVQNFLDGINEAAPELSRTLSAGLSAMVSVPQMQAPAYAGASSSVTNNRYETTLSVPGGGSPDPEMALAIWDNKLRARGGAG